MLAFWHPIMQKICNDFATDQRKKRKSNDSTSI